MKVYDLKNAFRLKTVCPYFLTDCVDCCDCEIGNKKFYYDWLKEHVRELEEKLEDE